MISDRTTFVATAMRTVTSTTRPRTCRGSRALSSISCSTTARSSFPRVRETTKCPTPHADSLRSSRQEGSRTGSTYGAMTSTTIGRGGGRCFRITLRSLGGERGASTRQYFPLTLAQRSSPIFFVVRVCTRVLGAARNLGCPGCSHVLLLIVQTGEQLRRNPCAIIRAELERCLQHLMGTCHRPRC